MRIISLLVFGVCTVSLLAAPTARAPVPGNAEQIEAMVMLSEITLKLPERNDPIALAKTLLAKSKEKEKADEAALRYVMLRESIEASARGGDLAGTKDAIAEIAKVYDVSPLSATIHALVLLEKASVLVGKTTLTDFAFAALDEAVAAEDYDSANALIRLAANAAAKRKDAALTATIEARAKDVQRLREESQRVRADIAKLASAPNDAEANDRVGRYLCFVKGEWTDGLPRLAKGKDDRLKLLAMKELRNPTDPVAKFDLADAWWAVAGGLEGSQAREVRIHAGDWYRDAAKGLDGDFKQLAEARLVEVDKLMIGRPPRRPASSWTVVFRGDDPSVWNTEVNDGKRFAKPVASVPADRIKYLKMTEGETKEFVIVEVLRDKLGAIHDREVRFGWDGRNQNDSGAFHLGIFDLQQKCERGGVVIRPFPWVSGWGFGHLHFVNKVQGYCWAGKNIAPTTFEISVSPGPLTEAESAALLKN